MVVHRPTLSSFFSRRLQPKVLPVLLILGTLWLCTKLFAEPVPELSVLTWHDYLAPELVDEFERETGIALNFIYYEDDDERDSILANTDGAGFDVLVFDAALETTYRGSGWLAALDPTLLPAAQSNLPTLSDHSPWYSLPYAEGAVGIVYKLEEGQTAPVRWLDFFRPDAQYQGKILVLNNALTTTSMALLALGYSPVTPTPQQLREAFQLLTVQRSSVHDYRNPVFNNQGILEDPDISMAMVYSGDGLAIVQNHPEFSFIYPLEGSERWQDNIAVMEKSIRKKAGMAFLNYLHRPDVNARNAQYNLTATVNQGALARLPEAFRHHPVIYPPEREGFYVRTLPSTEILRSIYRGFFELVN